MLTRTADYSAITTIKLGIIIMKHTGSLFKLSLLSLAIASSLAQAQQVNKEEVEEVVVTGYKGSLQNATNAKRESTSLVESVFAEDIGKFPDLNVAESIGRIPGIQLTRDINGDGMQKQRRHQRYFCQCPILP